MKRRKEVADQGGRSTFADLRFGKKLGQHISSPFIGGLVFSGGHFVNSISGDDE